jgi:hypothetical protein
MNGSTSTGFDQFTTVTRLGSKNNSFYITPSPLITPLTSSNGSPWQLTRTADTLRSSAYVPVTAGTVNAGTTWYLTTPDPITPGTTPLCWDSYYIYKPSIPSNWTDPLPTNVYMALDQLAHRAHNLGLL